MADKADSKAQQQRQTEEHDQQCRRLKYGGLGGWQNTANEIKDKALLIRLTWSMANEANV